MVVDLLRKEEKMPGEIGEIAKAAIRDLKRFSGGQIAPAVYLDQRPLGFSGAEVTELTAVWEGAERLAGSDARIVSFGENSQIISRRGQLRLEVVTENPFKKGQNKEVFIVQDGIAGRPRNYKETLQRGYGLEGLTEAEETRFLTVLGNIHNVTVEARARGLLVKAPAVAE